MEIVKRSVVARLWARAQSGEGRVGGPRGVFRTVEVVRVTLLVNKPVGARNTESGP